MRFEEEGVPVDGVPYACLVSCGELLQQLILPVELEQGHIPDLQLLREVCFLVGTAVA